MIHLGLLLNAVALLWRHDSIGWCSWSGVEQQIAKRYTGQEVPGWANNADTQTSGVPGPLAARARRSSAVAIGQ